MTLTDSWTIFAQLPVPAEAPPHIESNFVPRSHHDPRCHRTDSIGKRCVGGKCYLLGGSFYRQKFGHRGIGIDMDLMGFHGRVARLLNGSSCYYCFFSGFLANGWSLDHPWSSFTTCAKQRPEKKRPGWSRLSLPQPLPWEHSPQYSRQQFWRQTSPRNDQTSQTQTERTSLYQSRRYVRQIHVVTCFHLLWHDTV